MSNRQEIPFKTLWAENAETTIPATPVIGDSYRDEATTDATVGDGWAYGDPVPSQSENQYNYIQSLIARQLSEQGILSYSDQEDYSASVGAIVMDDGLPYLCLQDSGPSSTVKQPSTEPLYWFQFGITQVENRLKGNQVPVVEGSTGDPLPSAVATAYADQAEPAADYKFVTAATNVTFDAGLWKGTGQLQRKYKRDAAGFISKSSEYAGVRLHDNTQLRALVDDIATNGCSVTDDVDYVYVTFELSDFPSGVKFPFIAAEVGTIAEIGDDDSFKLQTVGDDKRLFVGSISSGAIGVEDLTKFKYINVAAVLNKDGNDIEYYSTIEVGRLLNGVGSVSVFEVTGAGADARFAGVTIDKTQTTTTSIYINSGSSNDTWNTPRMTEIRGIY